MKKFFNSLSLSIRHCKKWIFTIFLVYCFSCLTGIIMVHSGNSFALGYSERVVARANSNDKASINYLKGNRFKAVLIDFGENLFVGSVTQTFLGLGIIFPFLTTAYQGWIGGIVSVNRLHQSRLIKIKSALYYFVVIILQFIPYSLTIGSGLTLGIKTYNLNKGAKLLTFRLDKSALRDVVNIYMLATPLFLLASCFEFLSNWNV